MNFVKANPLCMAIWSVRAFDFVLWVIFAGMMCIPLVIHVFCMDPDDPAAHTSGLGIPGNMIADFEVFFHLIHVMTDVGSPYDAYPLECSMAEGFPIPSRD